MDAVDYLIEIASEYCRRDVLITRDLFMYWLEKGHLLYKEKRHNTRVRLFVDWNLDDMVRA